MKQRCPSSLRHASGLTLIEVLVVLVLLVVIVGMIPYAPARAPAKARRMQCVNNLKQSGLAFRLSATTNDTYSFHVPAANGGTLEWREDPGELWRHWRALSNHLSSSKLLICPSDKERLPAKKMFGTPPAWSFAELTNNLRVSYFLGSQTRGEREVLGIQSGDRNVTNGILSLSPGRYSLPSGSRLGWDAEIHQSAGNVLLGDGSVQQLTSGRLRETFEESLKAAGRTNDVWVVP